MHPDTIDTDPRWFLGDPAELVDALATVLLVTERPAWHAHAACRGDGPGTWFPDRGVSAEPAVAVCASCPVQGECLGAGEREQYGVWGGVTPKDRRRTARLARRAESAALRRQGSDALDERRATWARSGELVTGWSPRVRPNPLALVANADGHAAPDAT